MIDREQLGFEWDKHNIRHIARHDVTPAEVEQVFANGARLMEEKIDEKSGELRKTVFGETDARRALIVVWTRRDNLRRTVTAYSAHRTTRRKYARK